MPTSSQSQILSVVDYQLLSKKQQKKRTNVHCDRNRSYIRFHSNSSSMMQSKEYEQDKTHRLSTDLHIPPRQTRLDTSSVVLSNTTMEQRNMDKLAQSKTTLNFNVVP
jgi:hypothetical protein